MLHVLDPVVPILRRKLLYPEERSLKKLAVFEDIFLKTGWDSFGFVKKVFIYIYVHLVVESMIEYFERTVSGANRDGLAEKRHY